METKPLCALDPTLYDIAKIEKEFHEDSKKFIDNFYGLITKIEPPFAISLDGLWGTGKTTVMKILEDRLKREDYTTFWFNPWEYRKTESVVLAFLQCLAGEHKDKLNKLEKSGGKILKVLLKAGMAAGLKIYTKGNLTLKEVEDTLKDIEKEESLSFDDYKNSVETVKEEFSELIDNISKEKGNKPVIIFFDDLDRCLPDDAVSLLEALKNLFVTPNCQAIFICGIDTRVAKQFIRKHYNDIEENFAIDYFRKIFNLTISMPPLNIQELLSKYIMKIYRWDEDKKEEAEKLSVLISNLGKESKISSIRKYLSMINNLYAFQIFESGFPIEKQDYFLISLFILKEACQPLYEILVKESLKKETISLNDLTDEILKKYENNDMIQAQNEFLTRHFKKSFSLASDEWLKKYPILA